MNERRRRRSIEPALVRGAWSLLAVVHVPVLATVAREIAGPDPDPGRVSVGSVVALVLATALFTLKALDVGFLRLGAPRRDLLVLLLGAALVHHDAIVQDPMVVPAIVVAAASGAELCRRGRRWLPRWRDAFAGRLDLTPTAIAIGADAPVAPATGCGSRYAAPPRGPPARSR